jgi:hypothetical protein
MEMKSEIYLYSLVNRQPMTITSHFFEVLEDVMLH